MGNNITKTKYKLMGKGRTRIGLFFVVFLLFLFGVSSMIYTDSYEKILEEQRKLSYGAWHMGIYNTTKEVYSDIEHHGMVKSIGNMEIYGYAVETSLGEEQHIFGSVGYADNALIKMGNLTLLNGSFPGEKSEIAMEAAVLDRMGYSYKLGQEIKIHFLSQLENGDFITRDFTFTLCGVIKNYSAYWKSNERELVSCFVNKEFFKGGIEPKQSIFAELKPQYMKYVDDLSVLVNKGGYFVKNEFTYLQYLETHTRNFNLQMQQAVIVAASCVFIFILLYRELKQRYNSFVMMRTIGATKAQLMKIFLHDKLQILCVASIVGIVCGIICSYLLLKKMGYWGDMFTYYINITNVIVIIIALYLSGIASLVLSMTALFQIPLHGIVQQQSIAKKYHFRVKVFGIVVTCIAIIFIYVVGYEAWNEYRLYVQYCENYPSDYTFGMLRSKEPQRKIILEENLQKIKCAYGVEEVQTISMSDYYEISFEGDYNQGYAQEVQKNLMNYMMTYNSKISDVEIGGTLIGVSENLISLYINEIDSNSSVNELADGEVILYVPSYIKDENGNLLMDSSLWNVADKGCVYTENTIKIGDAVQIETQVKSGELNIVGIIRCFDHAPQSFNPLRPYSFICNENTYRELVGNCEYVFVLVYGEDTIIPYQTDVELSKIQTGVYFKNNRILRSDQLQKVILQSILALLLCVFAFFVMTVIRFGIRTMYDKQRKERYEILYKLGMSKGMMIIDNFYSNVREGLIGCSIAMLVFLVFQFYQRKQEMLAFLNYTIPDSIQFFLYVCTCILNLTDWRFLGVIVVIVYLVDLCIMMIHEYLFINRIG